MNRAAVAVTCLALLALSCRAFGVGTDNQNGNIPQAGNVDLSGYFLPDPTAGLDGLQSYVQTLSISFRGSQNGIAFEYIDTYRQESNRQINAQFTFVDIARLEGGRDNILSGHLGEAYYSQMDDGECRVSWGERAEGSQPFVPARLLPPLLSAREGGQEPVNGVQARRYDFDAAVLEYPPSTTVEGQVWLAEAGGYVVKYSMRIQGAGDFFGEGVQGEQAFEYELDQVDTFEGPQLPQGCLPVLTDFPIMDDAFDIQRLPGVLAYTSSSDTAQIKDFHEQQLQDRGWVAGSTHFIPDGGTTLVFMHMEELHITYVTLQAAAAGTWVTVKVEPMQPSLPGLMPLP